MLPRCSSSCDEIWHDKLTRDSNDFVTFSSEDFKEEYLPWYRDGQVSIPERQNITWRQSYSVPKNDIPSVYLLLLYSVLSKRLYPEQQVE